MFGVPPPPPLPEHSAIGNICPPKKYNRTFRIINNFQGGEWIKI